jgi:hypothetical protein
MIEFKKILKRLNRPEMWLCLSGIALYIVSLMLLSFSDGPTRFSLAFADLQAFFKGAAIVFGGMCIAVICTKHNVAQYDNGNLQNSAIYAVRAAIALAVVLAVT